MTDDTIDTHKLKILLVDDEPFIRSTIRQILTLIGIPLGNIYEAADVKSAIAETLRIHPHLVLCDVHMPDEDGFVYLAKLRKAPIPDVAAIPVVMLTSESREQAVLVAKRLHVDGYLVKPVSIDTVKHAVERALKVEFA